MAHARPAERSMPQSAILIPAVLIAALVIGLAVAFGAIDPMPNVTPGERAGTVDPAVLEAGSEWQRQREQQSGYTDPVIQSGRDWEAQRKQQSGDAP